MLIALCIIGWLLIGCTLGAFDWYCTFRGLDIPYILIASIAGPFFLIPMLLHAGDWFGRYY